MAEKIENIKCFNCDNIVYMVACNNIKERNSVMREYGINPLTQHYCTDCKTKPKTDEK